MSTCGEIELAQYEIQHNVELIRLAHKRVEALKETTQ